MVAPEEEALKQGLSITMLCLLAVDWHRRALVRLDDSGLAGFTLAVPGRPGIPSMEVLGAAAPELLDEAFDVSFQGVCQPGSAGGNRIVCFLASVPKSVAQDIIPGRTAFVSPEWLLAAAGVAGNTAGTRAQAGSGPFQENLIQGIAPDLARALTEGALRLPSPRTRAQGAAENYFAAPASPACMASRSSWWKRPLLATMHCPGRNGVPLSLVTVPPASSTMSQPAM